MTTPDPESTVRPIEYKGEPLDSERGPGLGCFRFQVVLLVVAIILTPLSVVWEWPTPISAGLLFLTIFLLRLVAADRRDGRRRPLSSSTPTVGELEDQAATGADETAPIEPPADDDGSAPSGMRE